MKRQSHLRKDSVAGRLLSEVSMRADEVALLMTFGSHRITRYYGFDLEAYRKDQEWFQKQRAFRELERRRYIKYKKVRDKAEIAFTQKGAREVLRLKILHAHVLEDETNCIVIFDIPERLRHVRIRLGRFLESAGFVRIQRSVFISPFEVAPLLIQLFRSAGLRRDWVRVYYAKEQ